MIGKTGQRLNGALRLKREMTRHLTHDPVTGLPNRALFYDRLDVALSQAQRSKERLVLMIADLDNFKDIIHGFGYEAGDRLLLLAGQRIKKRLRKGDTVARLGGDEFGFILPGVVRRSNAAKLADGIILSFQDVFDIDGREFSVTTSMGIAIFPEDGVAAEELLKHADVALYAAKNNGRDRYEFFSNSL